MTATDGGHGPYTAWVAWLDAFAGGTDLPAEHLTPIDAALGGPTVARLLDRVGGAWTARTGRWADSLRDRLHLAAGSGPDGLAAELLAARRRSRPLHALAADPRLPAEVRDALAASLRDLLAEAQDSLLRSAGRQTRDRERLLDTVRRHPLTLAPAVAPPPPPAGPAPAHPADRPRRRVIL